KLSEEFIRFYLMKFRSLDMAKLAHRKILIETFVNSVYIFDDKLVITYNADEKTETVTLEEINGSIIECSGAPENTDTHLGVCIFLCSERTRRGAVVNDSPVDCQSRD
ncbi:MAG: hypothetical protein IKB88_06225, partial [Clostridia bacterium]|nr:hypothetical protein [Clostridia bacterium]